MSPKNALTASGREHILCPVQREFGLMGVLDFAFIATTHTSDYVETCQVVFCGNFPPQGNGRRPVTRENGPGHPPDGGAFGLIRAVSCVSLRPHRVDSFHHHAPSSVSLRSHRVTRRAICTRRHTSAKVVGDLRRRSTSAEILTTRKRALFSTSGTDSGNLPSAGGDILENKVSNRRNDR